MESSSSIAGSRSTLGVGNLRSTGALYYLYLATSRPKVTEDSHVATIYLKSKLILESVYRITKSKTFLNIWCPFNCKLLLLTGSNKQFQSYESEFLRNFWPITTSLFCTYHCLNFGIRFWIQWVRYYFRKNINEISTHASQFCFAIVRYFLQVWAWSKVIILEVV